MGRSLHQVAFTDEDKAMLAAADALLASCRDEMNKQMIHKALASIIAVVSKRTAISPARNHGR